MFFALAHLLDIDFEQRRVRVDRFVEELLSLRIDHERPQRGQVEAGHGDRLIGQLLQTVEQRRIADQALDQVGVGVELTLNLQLGVDELLQGEVATGGLHFSGLANEPRSQVEVVDAAPVGQSDGVHSGSDDPLKLLELLGRDGKDLVDGFSDGDFAEVVAAVVLDELKNGLGVSGLKRSERFRGFRLESEVSGDGLSHLFADQLDEDETGSADEDFG